MGTMAASGGDDQLLALRGADALRWDVVARHFQILHASK